jgi:hypothetical protein
LHDGDVQIEFLRVESEAGMKVPGNAALRWRRIGQTILFMGIAGTALSGCTGNYAVFFPADWNLPESPLAPLRLTTSGPVDPSAPASPALIDGLQRQADCSLTYFDFSYASSSTAVTVTPNSQVPHCEKTLHDDALLNTTPDLFPAGCADVSRGTTSRPFLFLGTDKNGRELVAVPGVSGVVTSALKSDGTFTPPATQATQVTSVSLLSGDLNRDGNPDTVSINSNAMRSSVTVFLGKDDGTYEPGIEYALPGANAQYGVLDDLNGDGILDLLVSSDSPTFAFSIFIGNGDGTFQPPQTFAPAIANLHYNEAFLTADVNGDGTRDIVTAQGSVFLGKGDGVTYALLPQAAFPSVTAATNDFAPSIVAADFNNDGKLDLATDDGATIRTFQGRGDGTFTPGPSYPTIPNYGFLFATDLDRDGNIDLWTGYAGNGVYGGDAYLPNLAYALMGSGDGTFQGELVGDPNSATSASSLAKKRTSDAAQDLTLSAPSPGKLSVVAGQTSVPFTVIVSSPSGSAETVTLACSGLPVLATCMFQPGTVNLTPNQSSVSVSVMIGTTANTAAYPGRRLRPPAGWTNLQEFLAIGLLALSAFLFRVRRRRAASTSTACLLLILIAPLAGCTGGGSNSTTTFNGTPPGTYAITVTGVAGSASASTPNTLTLTVTSQ